MPVGNSQHVANDLMPVPNTQDAETQYDLGDLEIYTSSQRSWNTI